MKKTWSNPQVENLESKCTEKSPFHGTFVDSSYYDADGNQFFSYSA